jgi:signal transduction histidine kinase
MSLAARITLIVLFLLTLGTVATGLAFYEQTRRSLEKDLQKRLETRLLWIETALDVNTADGDMELTARAELAGAADYWEVGTVDGRVLWASEPPPDGTRIVSGSVRRTSGLPLASLIRASEIIEGEKSLGVVPPLVREAAREAVPGLLLCEADPQIEGEEIFYRIEGAARGKEWDIDVTSAGQVLSVKEDGPRYGQYRFPSGKRLELIFTARTSVAPLNRELGRFVRTMLVIGPFGLLLTGTLLALAIRAQLVPLARMAEQAAAIGPGDTSVRLGPVGSSVEAVRLRNAVNGMLERLTLGWERERRFAATAAHELRTPLAQVKTDIEVALRRERDASEYRAVLTETLADVDRLQHLVQGLLHLARSPEPGSVPGRPIPLSDVLRKAVAEYGPARLRDEAASEGVLIAGDDDLFIAAVGNVLENAARYAPGNPPLLEVEADNDMVRVTITDSGPGIPAEDCERIFVPLTRLDARSVKGMGLGLGLTVARATLRAFGGDLTCQPRTEGGRGAAFLFTFRRVPTVGQDATEH